MQSQVDAECYIAFNSEYVSALQGLTCAKLPAYHPTVRWDDFFFVEDKRTGAYGGDLCIPPDAFMRLLLGYRTLDELIDAWPDIVVDAARKHLWQTLWPKQDSYFWMPYMAFRADTRILCDEFSQSI